MDLDVAELLASLATLAGEDRATSAAAEVLGGQGVAPAVPLLQPLALSAATRRAVARQDGLLTRTRAAAAAASGQAAPDLARVQRVRPKTLLAIAAATAVFYFVLPELANVESSWRAFQSADWIWLPVVIACSALTYLASAIALLGSVSVRLPFWATALAQGASSFVNRVSPSNVGGMALNVRFLQKAGVEPSAGVAAVGVNALAGVLVHAALLVIFFTWPAEAWAGVQAAVEQQAAGDPGGRGCGHRLIMATRQGRRFAARKLLPSLRSSLASLRRVARSPGRLALLFGGSALVTLAYVGGLGGVGRGLRGWSEHREDRRVGLHGGLARRRRLADSRRSGRHRGLAHGGPAPASASHRARPCPRCSPTGWLPTGFRCCPAGSVCASSSA